ncbi:MAG: zinc-binding dehydrogenase [Acidimicrobiales bacterium]
MRLGDLAVVIGAGTIGMLVAEIVRASGAAGVVVIEPDPMRREIACDLGADAAFAPGAGAWRWLAERSRGLGADLVYDCAGTADSLASTVDLVRRGGGVVVIGVGVGSHLPWTTKTHEREITVRASLGYNIGDMRRVLDLMADDRLRLGSMIDPEPVPLDAVGPTLAEYEEAPLGRSKRLVAPNL